MSSFYCVSTPLKGVVVVERRRIGDARGFLSRLFCAEELGEAGFTHQISQINHTLTEITGTVRGLHFQRPPLAEDKLVTCLHGAIFDVALDLRKGSPTFLQWHAEELTGDNGRALLIPQGVAHGFQSLVDGCELIYLHSHPYSPSAEAGLNPMDPALAIPWPLPVASISSRDSTQGFVDASFTGVDL